MRLLLTKALAQISKIFLGVSPPNPLIVNTDQEISSYLNTNIKQYVQLNSQTPISILPVYIQETMMRFLLISVHILNNFSAAFTHRPSHLSLYLIQQIMRLLLITAKISKSFPGGFAPRPPYQSLLLTFNVPGDFFSF